MMPGTRMAPAGSICQVVSSSLVSRAGSIALHVNDASRRPSPVREFCHSQGGIGRALGLTGGGMPFLVDGLAPHPAAEPRFLYVDLEPAKEHLAHSHLVDDDVQPFDEQ